MVPVAIMGCWNVSDRKVFEEANIAKRKTRLAGRHGPEVVES